MSTATDERAWDRRLQDLLDGARAEQAVSAKARERWLRQQASEEATLAGTLVDLAEGSMTVSLTVAAGRAYHGVVGAVGRDFVALVLPSGPVVYVRLAAVAVVRPAPGTREGEASGDRAAPHDLMLAEALSRVGWLRPRVALYAGSDVDPVTGELRAVGRDVVTVRHDGPEHATVYVNLATLSEAAVDPD